MTLEDSKVRFTRTALDYERYRPSYPPEMIDWVVSDLSAGDAIADVGCGTGISSRALAARGFSVVGVEPNDAMRAAAERAGGSARYLKGEAAATGLADESFDLATAAQAFHWFELDPALDELSRILRRGGRVAAFWNVREDTPLLRDYEDLLRRRCRDYAKVPDEAGTIDRIRASARVVDACGAAFPNEQRLDRRGLLGRARSASYVAAGVDDAAAFERELNDIFDNRQRDGFVELKYRCVGISFRIAP